MELGNLYGNIRHKLIHLYENNAAIHPSKESKRWFSNFDIEVLDYSTPSADFKFDKNRLEILARHVYYNMQQFNSVPELKTAICKEYGAILLLDLCQLSSPK